ncbi:MAG: UDP-N-acetylmuramoyl-L-alanine--D-glutamate ligase [Opitutaceae bacterium]|nr:UDP-N-acetylmuramoyl-L-alanine--D-glutamate ligase [Opitutaceae bacterium]
MPLTIPEQLKTQLSKPVAIFGEGLSGEGVLAVLRALGLTGVFYDKKGLSFDQDVAKDHGLVVFSPGFESNHPWLAVACDAEVECMCELDFASLFWRGQVVAITGTNGKTTLTEFLTSTLRMAYEVAHAAGNIGRPFSKLVAETGGGTEDQIAVCEVSSFQAETLQHLKLDSTIWINFAEDHLDRHPNIEDYFSAKWNLVTRTKNEEVLVGTSVQAHARKLNRNVPGMYWVKSEGAKPDLKLADTPFVDYPQRENFEMALAWWKKTKRNVEMPYTAAACFRIGRHRLQNIREYKGATYWNDSKATNFHAVECAVANFDQPVRLILGGQSKGGYLAAFVSRLKGKVAEVFLIGEVAQELAEHCEAAGVMANRCETLTKAVEAASKQAGAGSHVLLSPGFASFDQFSGYEDRGNNFEKLVRELGSAS